MPNTVIALKKSAIPTAIPSNLANGELALNYADGKLYYKAANGTIAVFSSGEAGDSFGTVNAAGTLIVADTPGDILTLESGTGITITGDAVNDKITISADLSPALLQANTARTHANAAHLTANAGFVQANTARDQANTATTNASNAFSQANTARTHANASFDQANTARVHANASFGQANTARIHANSAYTQANAAYDKANTAGGGGAYFSGNNGDVGTATGLGDIFRVHTNTLTTNTTIYSGNNALAAGPITVSVNRTLTIQDGARIAIV